MEIKSFECPKSIRNYEKKILGMTNAWSTSRLSHWPSEPAYYIVDFRISMEFVPRSTVSHDIVEQGTNSISQL